VAPPHTHLFFPPFMPDTHTHARALVFLLQVMVATMKGFAVNVPNLYVSTIDTVEQLAEFVEGKFNEKPVEQFPADLPPTVVLYLDPPSKVDSRLPKYLAQYANAKANATVATPQA